jgi:flagellar protein FliO/FliZ
MRLIPLTRGAGLSGALSLVLAPAAMAAGSGESTPLHLSGSSTAHTAAASGSSGSIVRTIVAMVIVIAVIYIVARILKAIKGRNETQASGQGLTSLATLPLGGGRSLALVRSGRDIVLVGVAEQGVTPIKTYSEKEAMAVGITLPEEASAAAADTAERPFDRVLDQLRRLTVR